MKRKCTECGILIPKERLKALPKTQTCVNCSKEQPTEGLMEYGHKTAPDLVILPKDEEQRRMAKRADRRAR